MQRTNIPLLLNVISFSIYIINITTSWWKLQSPCCPQHWFCRGFFILETIEKKERGLAEQCKESLNHYRGASPSRGCVLPMPALRNSAGLGVTAWKTSCFPTACAGGRASKPSQEKISRLINLKAASPPPGNKDHNFVQSHTSMSKLFGPRNLFSASVLGASILPGAVS